jgi:Mn2+/Fe2+ NRAMP family transporter
MAMLVAVVGTTLSAHLYSWQSNQDVEEDISAGRRPLREQVGISGRELRHAAYDAAFGMFFASVVMYFIILAASATLFKTGHSSVNSAADAAAALKPLAGKAASILFALGVIGVGFIAVPVMTMGAAFDLAQSFGWDHGIHKRPAEAKKFYVTIVVFTLLALGINFVGINPMKALVFAGIVQGFSTPFLMMIVMRITNDSKVMGPWVNSRKMNALGWLTTGAMLAASVGLVVTLLI